MALSDCPKCWDTPCECGHEYRSWSVKRLERLIQTLQDVLKEVKDAQDTKTVNQI